VQRLSPSIAEAPPLTFLFLSGVIPAIVLEQEKAVTVLVGGVSTLKCSMTGGSINNYYMYWNRKNQDNTLTFICEDNSCNMENFQSAIDSTNNKFTLKIIKPSVRDNGIYYCASDHHSASAPLLSNSETYSQTPIRAWLLPEELKGKWVEGNVDSQSQLRASYLGS
uniref:Ig-like domain-containing protein n=1 Tax=Vombatus ursinus TaxID=29139 RepID=A0A4X2LZ64_VOMUR